jgi:mannose-1-phosphate guanylyltransferase
MKLIPVILCGGSGSRLWPISREHHPKPFLRLDDNQSLLQKAFIRAASLPGVEEILTITNRELFFKTQDDYVEVNSQNLATSFILEPFGRNTAAAITAAALKIASAYTPDTQLLILAADHIITNQAAFEQAVESARELAATGRLVALGTQPTAPETGYGYIEAKDNQVLRFIEKPSKETAEHYISSGHFYWNTGIFCFSANTFIEEAKKHCPDVLNTVSQHMPYTF